MKSLLLALLICCCNSRSFSQIANPSNANEQDLFTGITHELKDYKPDTSDAPDDKITREIRTLRSLRGGFNINEAIDFKIAEERQKGETSAAELDKIAAFFKTGSGKKWLDNALIWIYRRHFTYKELKQLVKFYKTDAGQKMAATFPVVMLQALSAAAQLKDLYLHQQKAKIE